MPLKAGPHVITAAFLERSDALNPLRLQPFIRSSTDTLDTIGHPHLDTFTLTGPFNPTGPGDTPSRRRIFVCRPPRRARRRRAVRPADPGDAGAPRLSRPGRDAADLDRLHDFYVRGRKQGTFDTGIQTALQRMLTSPKFVFRAERDPEDAAPGAVYRISDLELASRLSFFLWSSIPDDELLAAAQPGAAARSGGARSSRSPHAGRSESRGARRRTSPGSGCTCAT